MKRCTLLVIMLALLLALLIPMATADEEPLVITPYIGGPVYTAVGGQEVIIRAGWAACNRGLTEAFTHANSVSMEIEADGQIYLVVEPSAREFWSAPRPFPADPVACVANTRSMYQSEWLYSLGTLPTGEYNLHFLWLLDHPLPDGGDYDDDGRLDLHDGIIEDRNITIIVE